MTVPSAPVVTPVLRSVLLPYYRRFGARIVSLSSKMFKDPLCKKQSLGNISMIGRFRNISVIKFGESHR